MNEYLIIHATKKTADLSSSQESEKVRNAILKISNTCVAGITTADIVIHNILTSSLVLNGASFFACVIHQNWKCT